MTKPNLCKTNLVPDASEMIKIATLKKPYGIKGWLWVFSQTDERASIFQMQPWWMKTATGFKPLTVRVFGFVKTIYLSLLMMNIIGQI